MVSAELIENAKEYAILPLKDGREHITIGGKIMLNQVVLLQMKDDAIVATTGAENNCCLIMVDYSVVQVLEFIRIAKQRLLKMGLPN